MHELEPRYRHAFNAAMGWLELGNAAEAELELNTLPAELQSLPQILELRWRLQAATQRWEAALRTADEWIKVNPENPAGWINQAYCLHELGRTEAAWESLLPAAQRFPLVATFAYNLACYACQLNRPTLALQWLSKAIRLLGKARVQQMAQEDPDLAPLREQIQDL